jgi:hypothetical protein
MGKINLEKQDYHNILNKDFKEKISYLKKDKKNIFLLHFSCGADSIAAYIRLKDEGIKPILCYQYFLPDIPFIKNYIDYFEKKYNEKIIQTPSTLFYENFDNAFYQNPLLQDRIYEAMGKYELYTRNKKTLKYELGQRFSQNGKYNVIHCVGLKYTDGINRFTHLRKNGVLFKDHLYPVADCKVSDIKQLLDKENLKLPIEYKLWGISFESPRSFNIPLIKEHLPESYKYIKKYCPFIAIEAHRPKYNELNRHFKSRLTIYKDYAINKSEDLIW